MNKPPRTLGLFAKQPLPGAVKSRLAADTSADWAAQAAEALLLDTLDRLAQVEGRRVLAFAPPDARPYFEGVAGERFLLMAQADGDLGQRMETFFATQLDANAGPVVLVGADSPTLPLELIERAFGELDHADLILGPATDGGYYLIGCARRVPPIFTGVAWGGERVLLDTVRRLPDDYGLAVLPPWYDVDTLADWQMLCGHLAALRRAGLDPGVPRTEALAALDR
ncbi:MAG: TIGR04282 family arsenosugar biosynthesis glycosyltransferase [Gemmataceae bacterium]|nr:TIGR04282 family arsenosugar biosynthesis glycosyltransferase [Gemmataceae bacterium]